MALYFCLECGKPQCHTLLPLPKERLEIYKSAKRFFDVLVTSHGWNEDQPPQRPYEVITDSRQFFAGDDKLSLQEACELLGVSESTLRRRIKDGKINFAKPNGKDYRFKRKDLLKAS